MRRYSVESTTGKYVMDITTKILTTGYGFLSFARKYETQVLDTGPDASKKVVHKTGESLGNKIAEAVTKSNDDNIEKKGPVEVTIISPEKKKEKLN